MPTDTILVADHHMSHAASAFLCTRWDEAAILTCDGVYVSRLLRARKLAPAGKGVYVSRPGWLGRFVQPDPGVYVSRLG